MNIIYGCVTLRAVEKKDMNLLRNLLNDPNIEYMTVGKNFPVSEESQLKWFDNFDSQKELRCMIDINDGTTIGTIGLTSIDYKNRNASIFYKIDNKIENRVKGDINDAVKGLLIYAFDELNLECVYGEILNYNIFSQKILKKSGFCEEGVLRNRVFKKGKYNDIIVYSILKGDYENQKNPL
jgi:RimJ/RimL family protein N-acetyltransferase